LSYGSPDRYNCIFIFAIPGKIHKELFLINMLHGNVLLSQCVITNM
jgi:hypothetical protein